MRQGLYASKFAFAHYAIMVNVTNVEYLLQFLGDVSTGDHPYKIFIAQQLSVEQRKLQLSV